MTKPPSDSIQGTRDHGGNLAAAILQFGGERAGWLDLSTGINPRSYPIGALSAASWSALPDQDAAVALIDAARRIWRVPPGADVLAVPGASAAIATIPRIATAGRVSIPGPTYNEHEAAFRAAGWQIDQTADCKVVVHPNNPDGRLWQAGELPASTLSVIDESFCDVSPELSLIDQAELPGRLILKSFGKFWGLAGLRLGFVIGDPVLVAAIADQMGPWPVSGPALEIGRIALSDDTWADQTRARLSGDAQRLDNLMAAKGMDVLGGTTLFRLYDTADAKGLRDRLARAHVWSRIFPYSDRWIRLGLPDRDADWAQLEGAL